METDNSKLDYRQVRNWIWILLCTRVWNRVDINSRGQVINHIYYKVQDQTQVEVRDHISEVSRCQLLS